MQLQVKEFKGKKGVFLKRVISDTVSGEVGDITLGLVGCGCMIGVYDVSSLLWKEQTQKVGILLLSSVKTGLGQEAWVWKWEDSGLKERRN